MGLGLLFLFQVAHAEPTQIKGRVVSDADDDTPSAERGTIPACHQKDPVPARIGQSL
jgi:hypothetical protein